MTLTVVEALTIGFTLFALGVGAGCALTFWRMKH